MERTKAQRAVIDDRGGTLLVSAAAGSGKTSVLVERLLGRILHEGRRIDEFLIITFTKAAAEELRQRIARALSDAMREDPSNRHLRQQAVLLYNTQISTIHALCTVILREWGHALDIPLDFSLCEESDANILKLQALEDVLELRYENLLPDDHFTHLLDVLSAGRDDSRLLEITLDVYSRMQSHANPTRWMEEQKASLSLEGCFDVGETVWGQLLLSDAIQSIAYWENTLRSLLALTLTEATLAPYAESLSVTLGDLSLFAEAARTSWDAAASCSVEFPRLKPVRKCENPALQEHIKRLRSACKDAMDTIEARFSDSSESLLEDMQLLYPAMLGLFDLVRDFGVAYAEAKQRRGFLDFADLEHKTVALLRDTTAAPSEIAKQLAARYLEIMVDEYQDTNEVQNNIFAALSRDEQNLFLVGDVKQSIYRFRLADPTIFLDKYRRFVPQENAQNGESRKILLSENFRSRPEVLDASNFLFSSIMSERLGEMAYREEDALYPGGSFAAGGDFASELHVLHFEDLTEGSEEQAPGKHELEARHVASRIATLLRQGFPVSDGTAGLRPLRPEDIVILLRSPGSVRHHYTKALREAEIPFESEDEGSFFESVEVSVMHAFLQVIDNPRQDIPLLAVLHSPLYGFDSDALAQIRLAGEGDLYSALEQAAQSGHTAAHSFLAELSALRFEAVDKSCHALLRQLYERSRALELFRRQPKGAARVENLLAFLDLACRFEHAGHRGLFAFLYHLRRLKESGASMTRGVQREGGGVRLLSIHRSKGLEFPLVFLCGLGRRFNFSDLQKPVLFHQKLGLGPRGVDTKLGVEFQTLPRQAVALQLRRELLAEEMRLLYVAMTRAKDKLIMTHALSYGESDLKKLAPHIASPLDPNVLSNCSSAGQWLLLAAMSRPEGEVLRRVADAAAPFETLPLGSAWTIQYHRGIPAPTPPLQAQQLDAQDESAPLSSEALWARLCRRYPYESLAAIPAKITATDLSRLASRQSEGTLLPPSFQRPTFALATRGLNAAQRGTALHTTMQNIGLDQTSSLAQIQGELSRLAIQAFLSEQEVAAVDPRQLLRFFDSPIGQRMKAAPVLHREFPFTRLVPANLYYKEVPEGETLLMQGVIDCWFEDADGLTLLDFKTNRIAAAQAAEKAEQFRPQLLAYAAALEEITGKRVAQSLICFLVPDAFFEVSEDLPIKTD